MRLPKRTDAVQQFTWHAGAICAIAVLTVSLDAADPDIAGAAMVLLGTAAMTRWSGIETLHGDNAGPMSSILLDAGLGLMAADIIALWT